VVLTDRAREALEAVATERGERLSLVIGNGCCDATAPFLFGDYLQGPNELLIGRVGDVDVLIDDGLESSFSETEVVVDAIKQESPPDSFSFETALGYRFKLRRLPLP
jgi:uncharacterized protein (DUF779 family)